jgi:hypothetical protein
MYDYLPRSTEFVVIMEGRRKGRVFNQINYDGQFAWGAYSVQKELSRIIKGAYINYNPVYADTARRNMAIPSFSYHIDIQ